MIREGDIRRDLEIILPLKDKIDFRRVILVTDGTNPSVLLERGYMNDLVQKAVDLGIPPMEAVRMATLNPAEHFGMADRIGGIAPGRYGDLLLLPEPGVMKPEMVISKGRIVAEKGSVCVPVPEVSYPEIFRNTVKATPISEEDLGVPESLLATDGMVRTIDIQPGGLVTREGRAVPRIHDGQLKADPENDLLKIVFMERVTGRGRKFAGFVRGWGQKKGAAATTLCWDVGGILAIGSDDADLVQVINRLIEIQGGLAPHGRRAAFGGIAPSGDGIHFGAENAGDREAAGKISGVRRGSGRGDAFRPTYHECHDHGGHPVYPHDGRGLLPLQGRGHRGALNHFHISSIT